MVFSSFKWRGHLEIKPTFSGFLLQIFVVGVTKLQFIRFSHLFNIFVSICGSKAKYFFINNLRCKVHSKNLNHDTRPYKMVNYKFRYAIGISENCWLFLQCCQCSHPFWHWKLFQLASLLLAYKYLTPLFEVTNIRCAFKKSLLKLHWN